MTFPKSFQLAQRLQGFVLIMNSQGGDERIDEAEGRREGFDKRIHFISAR
jgi:hypothetical protein